MLLFSEQEFAAGGHGNLDADSIVMVTSRQATSHDENLYKEREQRCAAHFFIGQCELLKGDLLQAASSFRKVIASGATNCLEYVAAEAELQDLNNGRQ
jgi:lipoprotein NlpI